jgi:hypothetical protein
MKANKILTYFPALQSGFKLGKKKCKLSKISILFIGKEQI